MTPTVEALVMPGRNRTRTLPWPTTTPAARIVLLGLGMALVYLAGGRVLGGPTDKNPEGLLSVRPQAESTELLTQAAALHQSVREEIAQHEENLAAGKYDKANKRELAKLADTSLTLYRLDRTAQRLASLREPAGTDLQLRHEDLSRRFSTVASAYGRSEGIGPLLAINAKSLQALSARHERSTARIAALIEEDKWERAEEDLDEIYDDLHPFSVLQAKAVNDKSYGPFSALQRVIIPKMKERREATALQWLAQQRSEDLPKYEILNQLVAAAVKSAETEGRASWAGKTLDGPQLIDAWVDGWRTTHVKMLHCLALDRLSGLPTGKTPPSALDELLAAHQEFEQNLLDAMVLLIDADAARLQPADVPQIYGRYLQSTARAAGVMADDRVQQAAGPALDRLAQKSPDFAREKVAYQQATGDLLRWRRRVAAAQARRRTPKIESLDDALERAGTKEALQQRNMQANPGLARLYTQAPPVVEDVAAVVVGIETFTDQLAPQDEASTVSRIRNPYYTTMREARLGPDKIAALERDLLVDESHPPLTWEAAMAIETARQGRLIAAGGKALALTVEPQLVQLLTLKSDAPLPIGQAPDTAPLEIAKPALLWQVELQPAWLQHEYMFVEIPKDE